MAEGERLNQRENYLSPRSGFAHIDAIHDQTNAPVSTRQGPSFHPDSLAPHARILMGDTAGSTATAGLYSLGRAALQAATVSRLRMADAVESNCVPTYRKDGSLISLGQIPADKVAVIRDALTSEFKRAARTLEQQEIKLLEGCAALSKQIDQKFECKSDPRSVSLDDSIRRHVKSLPAGEARMLFLSQAISAGDQQSQQTANAILGAPGYLSGLSGQQMAILKNLAVEKLAPLENSQLRAVDAMRNTVSAAGSAMLEDFSKLCPAEIVDRGAMALRRMQEGGS